MAKQADPKQAVLTKKQEESKVLKYKRFSELKFMMFTGNGGDGYEKKALKPKALKEFEELEKEIKTWEGHKPLKSKTVFMASGEENIRIVEGYAVPDSIYQKFKDLGKLTKEAKYFA